MLYTASFYEPAHWIGARYRISRGHPRGKVTDWELQPHLYPSRSLLTEYRDGAIDFRELDLRYRAEVEGTYGSEGGFRAWVEGLAASGDVTLLCFEPAGEPCHRRLAAAWLLEQAPDLELGLMR
jgi:uncharacterized protein YeaO (DUF488 family)